MEMWSRGGKQEKQKRKGCWKERKLAARVLTGNRELDGEKAKNKVASQVHGSSPSRHCVRPCVRARARLFAPVIGLLLLGRELRLRRLQLRLRTPKRSKARRHRLYSVGSARVPLVAANWRSRKCGLGYDAYDAHGKDSSGGGYGTEGVLRVGKNN
eukprot:5295814-Pleurochrysis_carterae.AAC.1